MAFPLINSITGNHARDFVLIRTYSFARLGRYVQKIILFAYRFSSISISKFWIHLCYFVALPLLASLAMVLIKPSDPDFKPRYIDMLFMSTSAVTVSGLGTVVMESLSSGQVLVLTFLMLFGGEVFFGLLSLFFRKGRIDHKKPRECTSSDTVDPVELELDNMDHDGPIDRIESGLSSSVTDASTDQKIDFTKYMRYVVMGYTFLIHVTGTLIFFVYLSLVPSARDILKTKSINVFLFAFSTTVSSFANGGIIATNENMAIFNRHPALLLLIIAQMLAGNTLFPLCIRSVVWALSKFGKANKEFKHMLEHAESERFDGLLPGPQTSYLSLTVFAFVAAQFVLLCAMNWSTQVFAGLSPFQKIVNGLFMSVTTRHTGENTIDPSLVAPAVLVLYIVMMYFPSSTTFWPHQEDETNLAEEKKKRKPLVEKFMLSQASFVAIFVILICITERKKLFRDPINFSTLNIVFEVVSGYGNVGLSIGYSCSRLLKVQPDAVCQDKPFSFSGWWSDEGKLILAFVMLYGRLKKFTPGGGKAWRLY